MGRFTVERLSQEENMTHAHRNNVARLHGTGSIGKTPQLREADFDCAVIDTQAHTLESIVCYTSYKKANLIAAALNATTGPFTEDVTRPGLRFG